MQEAASSSRHQAKASRQSNFKVAVPVTEWEARAAHQQKQNSKRTRMTAEDQRDALHVLDAAAEFEVDALK